MASITAFPAVWILPTTILSGILGRSTSSSSGVTHATRLRCLPKRRCGATEHPQNPPSLSVSGGLFSSPVSPSHPRGDSACPRRSSAFAAPGNRLPLAIRRSVIVRRTTLRPAGWSVLQRGHDAVCRARYPIWPGSTDDPFALLEWPSDDPERVSVHSGLPPSTDPWAGLQCSRSHPLVASRIAGSAGSSVRRPRQSHRRERRLRRARPGRQ